MKLFKVLATLVLLGLSVSNAQAAQATAKASIDWSTFTATGVGYSVGTSTTNIDASAVLLALSTQSATSPNWTSGLSVVAGSGGTLANADASSVLLQTQAQDNDIKPSSVSGSSSVRTKVLNITSNGILNVSFDYLLEALLQTGDLSPNYANASVALSVKRVRGTNSSTVISNDSIELDAANTSGSLVSINDTLFSSIAVKAGDVIYLTVNTDTSAAVSAVPVPSAVWLFSTAMVGFLGVKRRKLV